MKIKKYFQKIKKAWTIITNSGFLTLIKQLSYYIKYHTIEKFKFIYFEISLASDFYTLSDLDESFVIRRATKKDIPKFKTDIFPFLTEKESNDRDFISQIEEHGIHFFVVEQNHKFIHYWLIFERALSSPLIKTPLDKTKIMETDAYMGSVFTVPDSRGQRISPHSILKVLEFLKTHTKAKRALILIHTDTRGAKEFYPRLGFKIMENVSPINFIESIFKKNHS